MDMTHRFPASPLSLCRMASQHASLLRQVTLREIHTRYRGSALGLLWSFLSPLLLLAVYTFVFTGVLKVRWADTGSGDEGPAAFALFLFCGLVVYTFFVECFSRAPLLILSNANYVKKVVFPLEILAPALVGSALFNAMISLLVLILAVAATKGIAPVLLYLPLIWFPYVLGLLGMGWFLSSLGVYFRDLTQLTQLVTMVMMFLSPIFYPVSAMPESIRPYAFLNPLTPVIEQTRAVVLTGQAPDLRFIACYTLVSLCFCWLGFAWFQRTRHGFADVL